MKLLKLEILNLASLDRPDGEVINFEEGALKDSTIFSIVGSTGSGKSTILNAICLALYNRAPRYPRQKGDRNQKIEVYGDPDENEKNRIAPTDCRNILTRGTKFGYSKLTFLANNGTIYRAEWSVEFSVKNFKNTITALYSISDVNGNIVEIEEDWEQLPMIIGLDYDQFLRTVLIAQGTFSNFLNAKEEERYALLEKLIGNEDLYAGIAAAIKKNKETAVETYNEVSASVAAYEKDLISDKDILDALAERILALEESETADKKELQLIADALAWYVAEKKFNENIVQYEADYISAMKNINAHKAAADRLTLHDKTLPAVDLYKEIMTAEAEVMSHDTSLTSMKETLKAVGSELDEKLKDQTTLQEKESKAKEEQQAQKPHIARARILMGELNTLRNAEKSLADAVKTAVDATAEASKAVHNNETAVAAKKVDVQEKKSALDILKATIEKKTAELSEAAKSAGEKYQDENRKSEGLDPEKLQSEKNTADKEFGDLKEALRITKDMQEKCSQAVTKEKELTDLHSRNNDIEKGLKALTIDQISSELEVLKKSYTLMTSESWGLHRKDLHEGEACPLCGSTHHPYSNDESLEPVVSELERLIEEKDTELKRQESIKSTLENERSTNAGKIEGCQESISELKKAIGDLEASWTELKKEHADWEPDLNDLKESLRSAEARCTSAQQNLTAYNDLTKAINTARNKMEEEKKALDDYKERSVKEFNEAERAANEADIAYKTECAKTEPLSVQLKTRQEEQAKAEKALEEGKALVTDKELALKGEIADRNPDEFEKEIDQAVKTATSEVEQIASVIGTLREKMKEIEGKIQVATDNRKLADEKSQAKSEELNEWLREYNSQEGITVLGVEDIAAFHLSTEKWEDIRDEQKRLDTEYTRSHTTLENERTAHKEHQQTKPEKTEEELSARKAELTSKSNTELVESKARMQRHEAAKAAMGELDEAIEKAKQAKLDWEEINDAIGGDGKTLRKIAQCYTLRFLIEHANVEIRKFNSRYELMQVKNSLGIRIIDHDRADDIRDTTSLSGGETFIVSLGLALGLSALSSRNISFENLFIDEGFGTLDPETLATVIDSLAMLQSSQGKKVGVISHTDTMSERITTQIRIIKNGNSGSSRIEIWPQ